jgi:ABC-type lipoprotein release transport system permease subunit
MADGFDFQGFMSGFGGAFFGAIIGAIIGIAIALALGFLNSSIGNTVKLAIIGTCIVVGTVVLAIHEFKKHYKEHT